MSQLMKMLRTERLWSPDDPAGGDPQPEPSPEPEPKPEPKAEPEPQPHPTPEPEPEPKPNGKAEPEPEPLTAESITFPEGVEINEELRDKFLAFANERKLTADEANTLVALQADVMKAASERNSALWDEQVEKWVNEAKELPDIGGDKLPETLGEIRKMLDQYGTPELDNALVLTGMGNHPELIKLFHRIATDLGEGKPISGGPRGQGDRSAAQVLFPNQGK